MITKPKCHISKQISNKVCISKICTQPAFICNKCSDDECEQLHYHDNRLEVARQSKITSLIQKIEVSTNKKKQFLQTMNILQKQVNKLIDDVNSIILLYRKRVKQYNKEARIDTQFKKVWDNLKEEKWDLITGRQIRMIYDKVKLDSFIINQEEIKVMKDKETENVKILLNGISQKINEYLKNDRAIIPQDWSKEDQQQLKINNKQIKENPQNSQAYNNRGWFYYNKNQLQKALCDYNKAIECDPKNLSAYNNRGILYKKRNQLEKALNDYNKVIQCDPQYSNAYYNRGILFYNRNQLEKALSDYNTAIECDPKFSQAYYIRGLLYHNINQLEKALSDYNKAIEYNLEYSDAYYIRGILYEDQNQLDDALSNYNNAIKYNPSKSQYFNNRGDIYFKMNLLQESLIDYTKALECAQKSQYYRNRAKAYRKLNMVKQAESDEKKSDELNQ